MKGISKEILKRMLIYFTLILILHFSYFITHINIIDFLKDNIFLNIAVSYLFVKYTLMSDTIEKRISYPYFAIEILLLGFTINIEFILFNELFLILCKGKRQKEREIMDQNVKEYFEKHPKK